MKIYQVTFCISKIITASTFWLTRKCSAKAETCSQLYNILYIYSAHVPSIFYYFVLLPTNAQLFHKLSHCYMFRHRRVILRQLVINILPSYTSISNTAVGSTIYN